MAEVLYKQLSDIIIGACIEVHKQMGPKFNERIYEACVQKELEKRGYHSERQKWVDIFFKGERLDDQYRLDMLVANKLILEFKTVPELNESHIRQLLCYLEATIYEVGYVLNFARNRLQFRRLVLQNDRKRYKPECYH